VAEWLMLPRSSRSPDGQFSRGTSGNPGGRPKRLLAIDAALQEAHTAEKVLEVVDKLRELAISGDVQAAKPTATRSRAPDREPR